MIFLNSLKNCVGLKVLVVVIVLDTIFGIFRALKNKKLNSCIGIDGMIRKAGMILSSLFLYYIDFICQLDLIGFLPISVKEIFNIEHIGIGNLFGILFILFETMSVLKNMHLCGLPIPIKIKNFIEKVLKEFTEEIKEGDNK